MTNEWQNGMDQLDDALLAEASGTDPSAEARQLIQRGGTLQRTGGQFATAVRVQEPRNLQVRSKMLMAEAKLAGEAFYYGWGSGKDRVIGPSIGLAMAAARVWGNCAVEPMPVEETADSWILTVNFIDLETGFTLGRQFRQAKDWTIHGRFDEERKDDMRFQIGQSKAARNVICNALPKWLIDATVREAQVGVRERITKYINEHGVAAAVDLVVAALIRAGVSEEAILAKCAVADRRALTVDHVVMLRGDLYAIENGTDRAETIFAGLAAKTKSRGPETSDLDGAIDGAESDSAEPVANVAEPADVAPAVAKATKARRGRPRKANPPAQPAADVAPEVVTGPATGTAPPVPGPVAADSTAPDAAPNASADEPPPDYVAPEATTDELPDGFNAALAAARSMAEVNAVYARWQTAAKSPAILDAIVLACEQRREEIRAAFRLGN